MNCCCLSLEDRQTIGNIKGEAQPTSLPLLPALPSVLNLWGFLIPMATGPSATQIPNKICPMFLYLSALPLSNWDFFPHSLLEFLQASP